MNLDYFFIEALVAQLDAELKGTLVKKIHQPRAGLFIFTLWNGRREQYLQLSAEAGRVLIGLTGVKFRNPMQPPRFCQLLRAHLHRLEGIRMLSYDRQVGVYFASRDGDSRCLVFDMFGRSANMFLYAQQQGMLDCLRRTPDAGASVTSKLFPMNQTPGVASGFMVLSAAADSIRSAADTGESPDVWLQEHIRPMSKTVARRIGAQILQQRSLEPLRMFAQAWEHGELRPQKQGRVLSMWPLKSEQTPQDGTIVDVNAFLNRHLAAQGSEEPGFAADPVLLSQVDRIIKKLRKRKRNIAAELGTCARHEDYQRTAELLDAHRYLLQRGMEEVEVQDYYCDPPENRTIALDAAKTPQENIAAAYSRARKARRGLEHCHRRLQETERELNWLEDVRAQLSTADRAGDEELVRAELLEQGYLQQRAKARLQKRRINPADMARRGVSPGGFQIVWGRNSRTNAYISRHVLKKDDLWFHSHNTPGCHLVLKTDGREPGEDDIRAAAAVAAYYSTQKQEHSAEVMWTRGRHVKHLKGGRPGMVTVDTYSSITVAPRHEREVCKCEEPGAIGRS